MGKKACVMCGAEFESRRGGVKYCGDDCRTGARKLWYYDYRKNNSAESDKRPAAPSPTPPVPDTTRCRLCKWSGMTWGSVSCDYRLHHNDQGRGCSVAECDKFEEAVSGGVRDSKRAWMRHAEF